MSIIATVTLINNFNEENTFNNVTIKVSNIIGNKDNMMANIVYYKENGKLFHTKSVKFIPTMEDNFIKQAYEHIKTLDEFKNLEDC